MARAARGGPGDKQWTQVASRIDTRPSVSHGVKPKDLLGIPWMVAFALRADGWYLRSEIIWAKPNPMPESVTDRPTKAHEYVFLLSKGPRYFWDADAIRERHDTAARRMPATRTGPRLRDRAEGSLQEPWWSDGWLHVGARLPLAGTEAGRNKRSVWTVATAPYPGAHFATFPPKLIEPCILAGSSPKACGVCGAPWQRVVERTRPMPRAGRLPARRGQSQGHDRAEQRAARS
jgi:hypothetical protein